MMKDYSISGGLKFLDSSFLLAGINLNRTFAVGIHFQLTTLFQRHGFQLGALWRWQNDQRFCLVVFVHSLANVKAVVICDVVILPQFLILQKVRLYLFVQLFNALVQSLLFLCELVIFSLKLVDVLLDFWWLVPTDPLYCVLLKFLHIIYALQHICDIVNSSLLHFQLVDCLVKVYRVVLPLLNEFDELFGKYW